MRFIFTTKEQLDVFDNVFKSMTNEEVDAFGNIIVDVSHYGYMKGLKHGAIATGLCILCIGAGVCLVEGTKGIIRIHKDMETKRKVEANQ